MDQRMDQPTEWLIVTCTRLKILATWYYCHNFVCIMKKRVKLVGEGNFLHTCWKLWTKKQILFYEIKRHDKNEHLQGNPLLHCLKDFLWIGIDWWRRKWVLWKENYGGWEGLVPLSSLQRRGLKSRLWIVKIPANKNAFWKCSLGAPGRPPDCGIHLHSVFLGPIRFFKCFYGHLRPWRQLWAKKIMTKMHFENVC